jgi:hypothetical protein
MVGAEHGRGMASVKLTRPHCVNQMGKTHSKPLAARHGRGTAWARHAMCESAISDVPVLHTILQGARSILRVDFRAGVDICSGWLTASKRL